MQSINLENWTYTRFENGPYRAFLSFGADPESLSSDGFLYFVTVMDGEEIEVMQKTFETLTSACLYANENYGDWMWVDLTAKKEGCSTCIAH